MSFSHFDKEGNSHMVDVSDKEITKRSAAAKCFVRMNDDTLNQIKNNKIHKGNVLDIAQLAGIMGAKKTAELIPLCHPLSLSSIKVLLNLCDNGIEVSASCKIDAKTGVEMESLTAVSISALTIYDMCKSIDKSIVIENIRLIHKIGGKSGDFNHK